MDLEGPFGNGREAEARLEVAVRAHLGPKFKNSSGVWWQKAEAQNKIALIHCRPGEVPTVQLLTSGSIHMAGKQVLAVAKAAGHRQKLQDWLWQNPNSPFWKDLGRRPVPRPEAHVAAPPPLAAVAEAEVAVAREAHLLPLPKSTAGAAAVSCSASNTGYTDVHGKLAACPAKLQFSHTEQVPKRKEKSKTVKKEPCLECPRSLTAQDPGGDPRFSRRSRVAARAFFIAVHSSRSGRRVSSGSGLVAVLGRLLPRIRSYLLLLGREVPEDMSLAEAVESCPEGGTVRVTGDVKLHSGLRLNRALRLEGMGGALQGKEQRGMATIRTAVVATNESSALATGKPLLDVELANLHLLREVVSDTRNLDYTEFFGDNQASVAAVLCIGAGVRATLKNCLLTEQRVRGHGVVVAPGGELRLRETAIKGMTETGVCLGCRSAEVIQCRISGCKTAVHWDLLPGGASADAARLSIRDCILLHNRETGIQLPTPSATSGTAQRLLNTSAPCGFFCSVERSSITRTWYPLAQQLEDGSWASCFAECVGLTVDERTELSPLTVDEAEAEDWKDDSTSGCYTDDY
eukprot:gnl/TRDRNA2_/TRDRNA2_201823_c0_seq1.p1 gnl/TRDRNA2_/TRDRNA2_201823_c0~~gnl/TRDRNA2_/TRDRNA2_201823_c0_seq1.p1  ORF type:complete len:670 (+),score=98.74 gnl/TRDRNA2_/TRDRNA2_201823_c0_seq1:290-2011(+)